MNFIQNEINKEIDGLKIIPYNTVSTRFFTVSFDGWKKGDIICDFDNLKPFIEMSTFALRGIIAAYKETHAFTQPNFFWKPREGTFGIRIGVMDNERWEKVKEAVDEKL